MKYLLSLVLLLTATSAFAAETLPVAVKTTHGDVKLTVEVVYTPAIREHGLMDRDTLTPNDGMLFLFPKVEPIAFWMKNTRIPLDMLFIDEKGRIVHIARNTTPYSEAHIDSTKPIASVIELAGGRAAAEKIEEGDTVAYTLPKTIHVE